MMTLSIVAGMLPTALRTGAGAGSRSAIAVAIVGGQAVCFPPALPAIPVVYSIFDDISAVNLRQHAPSLRLAFTRTVSGILE